MLKVDLLTSDEALGPFLNEVWESEKITENLRKGLKVKIPNKGDIFVCANWTIITLLSIASKMFWRISFNRLLYELPQIFSLIKLLNERFESGVILKEGVTDFLNLTMPTIT